MHFGLHTMFNAIIVFYWLCVFGTSPLPHLCGTVSMFLVCVVSLTDINMIVSSMVTTMKIMVALSHPRHTLAYARFFSPLGVPVPSLLFLPWLLPVGVTYLLVSFATISGFGSGTPLLFPSASLVLAGLFLFPLQRLLCEAGMGP